MTHIKATSERPLDLSFSNLKSGVSEEDFHGFNVPFDHFGRHIQKIDYAEIVSTSIILYEKRFLDKAVKWNKETFGRRSLVPLFVNENEGELNKEIERFEKKQGLTHLDKHIDRTPMYWRLLHYYQVVKKRGFYTIGCGVQGGGVSKKFEERFGDEKISAFAFREDFEYAYSCIDLCESHDTWDEVEIRKKNFKDNFLNNFEHGTSYLKLE